MCLNGAQRVLAELCAAQKKCSGNNARRLLSLGKKYPARQSSARKNDNVSALGSSFSDTTLCMLTSVCALQKNVSADLVWQGCVHPYAPGALQKNASTSALGLMAQNSVQTCL